ncbi:protein sidekick-2 isoform X1 [Thunnus thynnus]|uniref:protein sidekick-2 isoform X1 n=2 Tax=Thunnus maccoyii TaxID=8240 RepID=UPI001C4B5179|nr:protein sidekick-2 isoform X1 [Thunnus maccoyii]XP_042249378.1 protein sidekick-2 isoform X1 [Thunnus maccoyii]
MFPAWRRGRRTGGSTVPPGTMVTAGQTAQVGQVWVSCWILLSATCILSAQAQVDDVPPYFKMEPPQTQVHLEGNRLVLTCMAEGSWPLEFKWIYNGTELTRFSLEYRYLIPSLDQSHAGHYRCIVRNRVGAIMQCSTEVQVAYMGGFVEGERSQTVSQGEGALIQAPRIHSFPRPQITWFRDGRKIPSSSRIAITLDNTLVILSTVAPDAGRYYAQAVNDKNGENKTSQPVTLTVENVGGPADPIAPSIIVSPKNTSVTVGRNEAIMECVANARPLVKMSITWRKDGVVVNTGIRDFGRRLVISLPAVSDSGYYECEASLRSSSVPSVTAGAFLHVLEYPLFVKEPPSHISAEMEKVVDIPCQARGTPQPDIVWYKDAVPISPVKIPRYRVLVGGSLQINGLLPDDTGMFQCFARNLAGEIQTNTYLAVTSIAPNITAGPADSAVIDGMSVILHCETSGAPRPAITWQKGERVLASGSVQLPRFTLLESGSLLISPSHLSDAGTYTCMASNSRGIDEASADLVVWARTRITKPPQDQSVIKGTKAVMTCGVTHDPSVTVRYVWEKSGSMIDVNTSPRLRLDPDGTLHISQTWSGDIGTYTCRVTSVGGNDSRSAHLRVRQLPHAPENPIAVLSATEKRAINLTWAQAFDGNSPLIRYILEVSENNAPWTVLLANIEPESTGVTVGGLIPARSYQFRLCAVNDVGRGQFSKETDRLTLPEEPPSAPPQTVIASGRTNQSIMIQWQPPPESHQNGPLQGYIIRYCLSGLPVDCQMKNITNPDQTSLLLEELIIWTNYEIEVAAYNGAGRGTYSHKVTEWTLQGVPTVPPGNVHAEAVNSTTVRFTWSAPSPQFINGINQGYKLLAWEPNRANEVTVVTVRPNFQDTVHVGYISGLKRFTEYYSSVLCFTTPGDGPRSQPQRIRTHEDTPGAVGHLSFTDILDTSLKVSWKEPQEKNGLLTGYRISWEEFNRTNTRVTHYLPNLTQEYKVTGLTALTTYTIQVAAMTSKGQGQLSSSTISSGVPPELPGPPTNLAISNIGPRSVTLQFKPGYDGKTSISRWQVEAQIGIIGENEEWLVVHQLANEPDARSLEVLDLNPYTFYRFRMRQVNIVGTSPPSQPSRKIQTLQAPPDIFPANVTLRTASETSLWLRWVPLPEWEYNGNPDLVGYRVQYSKAGSKGGVLSHVIVDRLEREFTIEDLEEWMEYEVRVQAINGIGSGPWSQPVHGRTRESVPSSGPTNVSAFATTSSSILVRWGEVSETDRNGLILGYKVVYKEKDSDTAPNFWTVEGNTSHSVQLSGLGKYVLYEIQVLAFTRIGDGRSSSPPILERTLDDVPGPPVGILFPEVRTTSVRLIWQPPAQPNGIILAYQITYRRNSSNSNAATVDVLSPSARQYTAAGLKPEMVYVFRLTAQTRKGWGEAAEALVVTTEKRARPQPTSRPTVPQEEVQARKVLLSWEPGSDGLSPVRYYTVQYRELPDSNWTVHSASVSHETHSYIVDRLKPFTSYQFRIKATNDIGDSEYSQESEAITTLQDAPDKAPTILSVTPHTTTSVLVRWQPPSEDHINGVLLGFRVRYRELHYDRIRSFTVRTVNSASANWADLTAPYSVRNLSESSLTQYELDNLSKHKRYEIRLSVYNAVGEGPSSAPQEVFVGEAVPTAPPQNVVVQSSTATQLDVTWDPPPLDAQNGDIQGYKIYFWEFQLQNETERLRTLFLPELGVKLKNLTGYTTYMISVAAFNAAGDGPRSLPTRGRTQQAAPSAPSFIHFSELTTTSVNVSWGEPKQANGIIEGYRLVYEPCTPVDDSSPRTPGVSKIVTVDVKGSAPLWMKIKDLADGVTYNFRIRAKTLTYGPEVEANITTGPGEGAPGPPGEPFISRYGTALTLHWASGDQGRAPITRYVIEARPSDEGLWDILIKDIPKEVTSYTLNLDMLREGVTYDFRVIAVNDYGYGSPSAPSPSISAQKVSPFYEEWWFLVVIALVGLIFILLLVFILIIRGQSKKYTKKADSVSSSYPCPGNHSNCTALPLTHGEMVRLDEGRFPALELNNRRLSVKNSFCRKNGIYTRSPPRPSPGSLHYSDEDVSTKYNDLIPAESSSLTEKPSEISDSQGSDSEYEMDQSRQKTHSFVNHYISDPTYYNSWRRQQKGVSRPPAYGYSQPEPLVEQESRQHPPPVPPLPPLLPQSAPSPQPQCQGQGTLFRPKGSRTPTPSLLSSEPPSQHSTLYRPPSSLGCAAQAPTAGFSSFV